MLLTYPLMVAIQEISGRIGRITGHGIAGNVCRNFGGPAIWSLVVLLFAANAINIAADLGAMGDVEARNEGLVGVYAGADTGVIAGATLFGPGMDHIAHLFALAIQRRETADTLLQLPFYHPTVEEGLKPALREICEAVKSPMLPDLDDVAPPGA